MATERSNRVLWVAFFVFLICFVYRSVVLSIRTPIWMDEVLTLWVIRLPSASGIYDALARGAQFSPPAFHWALHYYSKFAGESYLALRLPSIAAVLITGFCSLVIFRRYLGTAAAVFGFCMLVESLRSYALSVRPYALSTACFALALLLFDDFNRRPVWWRSAAIALLLALAISFHIYSVLLIPCLGLIELVREWRTRTFRLSIWIGLVAAGLSTLIWLPLIVSLQGYLKGYVDKPMYWGTPTPLKLIQTYIEMVFQGSSTTLPIMGALTAITLATVYGLRNRDEEVGSVSRQTDFGNMMIATALLPFVVYVFSALVTKTYHPRYTIAGTIGTTALIVGAFARVSVFKRIVPLLVLMMAGLTLSHRTHYFGEFEREATFSRLKGTEPIVIADGVQFFPLVESAPPEIRSRLIYLTMPVGEQGPDPWDQHQIELCKALNPNLPVQGINEFLAANAKFSVLDTRNSDDTPELYLLGKHLIELQSQDHGVLIFKSVQQTGS